MRPERIHKGGKRPAAYVAAALRTIQESVHPLSTMALIQALGLTRIQEPTLRRALRKAAQSGRVLRLARGTEGSFYWAKVDGCDDLVDPATLGAAYAAQMYLRERLGGEIAVDIEACRQVIASTMTRTSD
jgi:hypothetical protein